MWNLILRLETVTKNTELAFALGMLLLKYFGYFVITKERILKKNGIKISCRINYILKQRLTHCLQYFFNLKTFAKFLQWIDQIYFYCKIAICE